MNARIRTSLLPVLTLVAALTLAGCSASSEPEPASSADAAPADPAASTAPAPAEEAPAEPTPAPAEKLTCETLIPDSVTSVLAEEGWSATASQIYIGADAVKDSLMCTWTPADSFGGQMYGVGVLTDEQSTKMRAELKAQGWTSEKAGEEEYFSAPVASAPKPTPSPGASASAEPTPEEPTGAMAGMTYLFADGWVKYADTREGLLLIATPAT